MKEVTKEEYLEAVREGVSDAFSDGIGSLHALSAAITEGVERSTEDWLKGFIQETVVEGLEEAISRIIRSKEMIPAIKAKLMKGEKPCKS